MSAATSAPPADNDVTIHDDFFAYTLKPLWHERRYRVVAEIERIAGRFPCATWHSSHGPKDVVICSNDYPGMGRHRK
jgi:5-aminolevulinate synthase